MEMNELYNIDEDNIGMLHEEKLIGWSATCLDQTISYYMECNCNEIEEVATYVDKSTD
uniref:Uncharacterized protein n=1 Tax=Yamadaella caenomyce TaxID=259029 RepID=A0A1G4NZ28_9FLOR|nr:Hypothetical protein ORF_8 [Yamadaella caenomyce]SCW23776.1 Hypothetical protein ORF_8 [Yamadaella caenomyce]